MRNSALRTTSSTNRDRKGPVGGAIVGCRSACAVLAVLLLATACTEITSLQQSNPGQLSSATVFVPSNADLIVNSSKGDFDCAFNSYIVASGLFVDELANAISNTASTDLDRRTITSGSPYGTAGCTSQQLAGSYTPLAVARASNDTAVAHLQVWTDAQVPNRSKLIGVASAYAGYSLVLLGEGMCSAAINSGPELTPAQLFAEAKTRFDTAVVAATRANDTKTLNLALLGRARTQLNLGKLAEAAVDAALVPAGFEVDIDHDAVQTRRQNMVYVQTQLSNFSAVDTSIQNLFAASRDPRIAVTVTTKTGSDNKTLLVYPNKDASATALQAIAKYSEARLIVAESNVATGNLAGAVTIINALETAAGQPAFNPSPLNATTVMAQIVEERKRELFLEGHRLGDIRRYILPVMPVANAAYPTGGTYSAQTCFPLPDVERINNPTLNGKH